MTTRAEREARRPRSARKLSGANRGGTDECSTGHPPLFDLRPAFELERLPEGGGYPVGFVDVAARLMGCTDVASILHLCSGSVKAARTLDLRETTRPSIVGDVRWLPVRARSVRWVLADPPYEQDYAEAIWGLGKQYPTPVVIMREVVRILEPGGRVGFLHHVVPDMTPGLTRLGTWGVTTGVGYRIRAFTVAERDTTLPGLGH